MTRRHWLNLAGQLLILASMAAVAAFDEDIFVVVISISLLILPPINWAVAGVLVWTSRQDPSVRSLADASDNALTWAVNSTVAALIGAIVLLRVMGVFTAPIGTFLSVMLGFIVVTSSLPAIRFLQTWRQVWLPMVVGSPPDDGVVRVGDADPRRVVDVDDVVPPAGAPVDKLDRHPIDVDRPTPPVA